MTYCAVCSYMPPSVPFCPRCGHSLSSGGVEEEGLRRLRLLEQLVANRVWDAFGGPRSLRSQVEALQKLEAESPEPHSAYSVARRWTIPKLGGVLAEPDLSLRHRLLDLLCGWLAKADAPALHDHFERLKLLIAALQAGAKSAAEGKMAGPPAGWLAKTAAESGFDQGELRRAIYATPHYWSKLCQMIDARETERAKVAMLVGYGYAALSAKNFPLAESNFQSAAQAGPGDPRGSIGLGDLFAAQQQHAQAVASYRRAADLGTDNVRVLNNLAWHEATSELGRPADLSLALAAAERAAGLAPVGFVLDTLAEVYLRRGNLPAAMAAARAAYRDEPHNEKYALRLANLAPLLDDAFPALGDQTASAMLARADGGADPDADVALQLDDDADADFSLARPKGKAAIDDDYLALDANEADDFELSLDSEEADEMAEDGSEVVALDDEVVSDSQAMDFDEDYEDFGPSMPMASPTARPAQSTGWNFWPFGSKAGQEEEEADEPEASGSLTLHGPATSRGDFSHAPPVARDKVDCSAFAPTKGAPGEMFLVQVAAHLPVQAEEAQSLALESDPAASRRGRTALATEIARGSTLTFELVAPSAVIDDPIQSLTWEGRPGIVQYFVTPPRVGANLLAKVLISQDGVPIGQIKFAVALAPGGFSVPESAPVGEALRYRRAFASYASPDRAEVVRRVQMLRVAGIQCFQDVLDLEPGERWEKQLWKRIDESDVLFLFWSDHAKSSKWVAEEWRYGLNQRGLDFIKPVILQRQPFVEPPPELNELHFNDKVLAMIDDQPESASKK